MTDSSDDSVISVISAHDPGSVTTSAIGPSASTLLQDTRKLSTSQPNKKLQNPETTSKTSTQTKPIIQATPSKSLALHDPATSAKESTEKSTEKPSTATKEVPNKTQEKTQEFHIPPSRPSRAIRRANKKKEQSKTDLESSKKSQSQAVEHKVPENKTKPIQPDKKSPLREADKATEQENTTEASTLNKREGEKDKTEKDTSTKKKENTNQGKTPNPKSSDSKATSSTNLVQNSNQSEVFLPGDVKDTQNLKEPPKELAKDIEMGNKFGSDKRKSKDNESKRKDKESKKNKGRKSKSPPSDKDLAVDNRSSIETTDSYSSAATLVATANAAVGRRSPKKSPRGIPRSGVRLRDAISSDDESFVSAGFRTPQATTPQLKRAAESTSQKLLELGKTIERGLTEKFTNRSPSSEKASDSCKKTEKTGNAENSGKPTEFSGLVCALPEKFFSSLPKRSSKDATVETDSDSFAMFENTDRLYASLPKDYCPIDDNLSDDVFMSCIDLAANSPDIPSRSQNSRAANQSSPASVKTDLGKVNTKSPSVTRKEYQTSTPETYAKQGKSEVTNGSSKNESTITNKMLPTSHSPLALRRLPNSESLKKVTLSSVMEATILPKSEIVPSPKSSKKNDVEQRSRDTGHASTVASKSGNAEKANAQSAKSTKTGAQSPPVPKHNTKDSSLSPSGRRRIEKDSPKSPRQNRAQILASSLKVDCGIGDQIPAGHSAKYEHSISPKITRKFAKEPSPVAKTPVEGSPVTGKRARGRGSVSPRTPKRSETSKSPTVLRREGFGSPTISRRKEDNIQGQVSKPATSNQPSSVTKSPTVLRRPSSRSPVISRKIPTESNKVTVVSNVTVVAQTKEGDSNKDSSFSTVAAKAEEESTQIHDSPKLVKQEKISAEIAKKKEHLRSTYDNVPDSDDSMIYFTSKNDPHFFEDNCVSEEIIATEQTPMHYKVEEPKKLGIEIMKAPTQAKLTCVSPGKQDVSAVEKKSKESIKIDVVSVPKEKEPEIKVQGIISKLQEKNLEVLVREAVNLPEISEQNKEKPAQSTVDSLAAYIDGEMQLSAPASPQVSRDTRSSTSSVEQSPRPDNTPTEHLTKRQIRRRNKKKNLQLGTKGSLDSGSDAPLSPKIVTMNMPDVPVNQETLPEPPARVDGYPVTVNKTEHLQSDKVPQAESTQTKVLETEKANNSLVANESSVETQVVPDKDLPKDHVPPPSPSTVDTLNEIVEVDEDADDVDNAFIDDKAREVQVFGESILKRLSSLVESQEDSKDLERRYLKDFGDDSANEEACDPRKCLVVLDELCNMGEKFKKENDEAVTECKESSSAKDKTNDPTSPSYLKPEVSPMVQKRPSIPCELQLPNLTELQTETKVNSESPKPKRDSQQIKEVINSYTDEVSPLTATNPSDVITDKTVSSPLPLPSNIVLRKPSDSSDEEFLSPERRFSGDPLVVPDIEETFSELMSVKNILQEMEDKTPTSENLPRFVGPDGMASPPSHLLGSGRRSRMSPAITERTESELDLSEQLDNVSVSTDSMYADDEDDGSEMIFSKTYTEESGGECLVSYTFYNTAHDYDSDEFWAESSAAEENYKVLEESANQASCTFKKARNEMHDIQRHLQDLRRQMEYLQDDVQTTSLAPSLSKASSEWRPITE